MKYFFLIFFGLFCFTLHAQDMKRIDSLKNKLRYAKEDTAKASLLNYIGWAYHNYIPDTTLYYVQQAYNLAKEAGDKRNMAFAKYYMGKMYYTKSNDSASISNYTEAIALFEEIKNIGMLSTAHMQMGYTYHHQSRYADVLNEYMLALKYAEQSEDKSKISDALYSLSDYYLHSESRSDAEVLKAEPYLLQALAIDKELNNKSSIASDYQYLGVCYTLLGRYKEAEQNLLQGLQMFKDLKDNFHTGAVCSYLGNLYDATGNYDKSISYLLQ
ncbi:MAG TPA: tetratricopeptide repeat protein, partial [Chitinophagaceae bacterium]|nr:tetratricopeptide repeat protein [Chitinophagaceae bacterium]